MNELLVADVGGTGSRLAILTEGRVAFGPVEYFNKDYAAFEAVLADFLGQTEIRPPGMALAVAGPVRDNSVRMTNLGWSLSASDLSAAHSIEHVEIMNDFAALAWSTLYLGANDLYQVGGESARAGANRAILGPGTGLGVSGLISAADHWCVMAGEGGHVTMAATTPEEASLIAGVVEKYGHCSAERLLSGPGLAYIYSAISGKQLESRQVTALALAGDEKALHAINVFSEMLGTVAANLALTVGAHGGVYLAGGILPSIREVFGASGFRDRFEAKARFSAYLRQIPVYVITARYPSFVGLDGFMRQRAV